MRSTKTKTLAMVALACGVTALGALEARRAPAAEAKPQVSADERAKIESVVHDYLLRHPEVVLQALKELDKKQQLEQAANAKKVLQTERKALLHDGTSGVFGNPQGDVTIAEFFDYNCGYCRTMADELKALIKSDPNVRIVLREWPIRGPGSHAAAKVSLAAARQNDFAAFHFTLLATDGTVDEARALSVAKSTGLDMERLRRDMKTLDTEGLIAKNEDFAHRLGIEGTPGFILGDTIVPGATSLENLKKLVAETRAACKKAKAASC